MGDIGDERTVQPLIDAIKDDDVEYHIKEASLISLDQIGNRQAIWALILFLKDFYHRIQIYATYGLYCIGKKAMHILLNL